MIEIVPFLSAHASMIALQPVQAHARDAIDPAYAHGLFGAGPAITLLRDREPRACLGLAEQWLGRFIVWAMISAEVTPAGMLALSLHAMRWLDRHDWRRIEAHVFPDHVEGHRWVKLLGFTHEGRMRRFAPDGRDVDLYAIVRGGPA